MRISVVLVLCVLAGGAVGVSTLPLGGQDDVFTGQPVLPAVVPGGAGLPGPDYVSAPAPVPTAPMVIREEHRDFFWAPGPGGPDEETRKLHDQERQHEQTAQQLLQEYRDSEPGSDRDGILQKLSQVVQQQFETRQQLRAKELEALEARVQRLRELHNKREQAKADIVERRVDQLVREADGLGWGGGPDQPGPGGAIFLRSDESPRPPRIEARLVAPPR